MSDPTPPGIEVTREELQFRRIDMRAWSRSDGLYEVEGRVTDRKPFEFKAPNGFKVVPAGEPIHDMGVRLVFDAELRVHEVSAFTSSAPYGGCMEAGRTLQVLKGLRMSSGWGSEVRKLLGGVQSCTHLVGLLVPMATTAYQSLTKLRIGQPDVQSAAGRPVKLDSCYAYATHGDVVRRTWPQHYTGDAAVPGGS